EKAKGESFITQCLHRIDSDCTPRWYPAGEEAGRREHHCHSNQRDWIVRVHSEKLCPRNTRECYGHATSQNQSHSNQSKTLAEDQIHNVTSLSADSGSNGDLASARSDRQRKYNVDSDQRQEAPDKGKGHQQPHGKGLRRNRIGTDLLQRFDMLDGNGGINGPQFPAYDWHQRIRIRYGSNHEMLGKGPVLPKRKIDLRFCVAGEHFRTHVRHDPDNFSHILVTHVWEAELAADRILPGKKSLGHCFIDNGNEGTVRDGIGSIPGIGRTKSPPLCNLETYGFEVIRGHRT